MTIEIQRNLQMINTDLFSSDFLFAWKTKKRENTQPELKVCEHQYFCTELSHESIFQQRNPARERWPASRWSLRLRKRQQSHTEGRTWETEATIRQRVGARVLLLHYWLKMWETTISKIKINQEETKTHKSRQTHTDRRQNIEVLFSTGGRATTADDITRSALHFVLLEMK